MTEFLATCWTHSGDSYPYPGEDISSLDFMDRAAAVAEAGYTGIGIFSKDLAVALRSSSLYDVSARLRDLGLVHIELEFLTDWWADGEARAVADADRALVLEAADVLGARHVKIGAHVSKEAGSEPPELDVERLAPALRDLAEDAERHGTRLALEFLPMSNVATVDDGMRLIDAADHPAVGLCVDNWHVERGETTLDHIRSLRADRVVAVELNDAFRRPVTHDIYADTLHHRVLPGDGDFDLAGFVGAVQSTGFDGPWGVEILSADARMRPIQEVLLPARLASQSFVG